MRALLLTVLLLISCSHRADQGKAAPDAPDLDIAGVTAKSHAFVEAHDRDDASGVAAMLGKSFVRFEQGRFKDQKLLLEQIKANAERHAPALTRVWSEEHISIGNGTATFIGDGLERFPPSRPGEPETKLEFWNSIVWVREGSDWKVAYWHVERIPSAREEWNEAFRGPIVFKKEPNQLLIDTIKGTSPGTALDIAMGQGRNALYLASQGWKVTGIDISDEGIRIAKETAVRRKLQLEAIEADMDTWDYGKDRWDLVTMIFAGADPKQVERLKPSLKKGGLLVVEVFHAEGTGGTRSTGFATGQLAALFKADEFTIIRDEVALDVADWGPPNKIKLVRFVAQKR